MDLEKQALARVLITAVMHRYASHARDGADWNAIASCFEPDGTYRLSNGREILPSQAKEVVRGNEAKYIRHHITTIDIVFVNEDEAHSNAQFFATTEHKFFDHSGHWRDIFRRQKDGSWLIHDRTIVTEKQDLEGWSAKVCGEDALLMSRRYK
ncbi:hypothetical protein N7517_010524 [Penicillium concentricum]|uniref:SnoaL-like domain-containing protein n=1 Tax=Penicillium concentricum TaxID=293559 RepID=A0A9W9UUI1_9EURO|nr:uncharacterized protein N7517_010524 [Penicillium concentricum]KAJ5355915.1 hypothetical protein N7517_010524 [Penicillium concentricum]